MGLIKETNAQYYSGEDFVTSTGQTTITSPFNVPLNDAGGGNPASIANYVVAVNSALNPNTYTDLTIGTYSVFQNTITIPAQAVGLIIRVRLIQQSIWDNYNSYAYLSLKDVVNNFMVGYVGLDKVIPRVKRSDVIFHAKRGLQEFSYDTLKSVNQLELSIPPSLSLAIPQDYVNYVQLSWVDTSGVKHIIYPTRLTSNPTPLLQDSEGVPVQGNWGENLEPAQSETDTRWASNNNLNITGQITNSQITNYANVYNWSWWKTAYGQRYGLEPETSQKNGWFTINEREGKFSFSSDLANQIIILEYVSDGLAYNMDSKIPKMAEEALYMHIAYSILAGRANVQEYIVQRFKKDRRAQLRNAKIRLSNIKIEEFTQVMRGKSKWIKH